MTDANEPLDVFAEAAIVWAAGGRGQPLVDAAAEALAAGLDSPTLRMLAGAPHMAADAEATDLAPTVFEELGLAVHDGMSPEAIVDGARLEARRFVMSGGSPQALAHDLSRMYVNAGYPEALADWSGLDDWYDMLDGGVIAGRIEDADEAVAKAARALAEGRPTELVPLGRLFSETPPPGSRFGGDAVQNPLALEDAIEAGDLDGVEALLRDGADPNASCHGLDDSPVFEVALRRADAAMIRLLAAYGADFNRRDARGQTLLHHHASGSDANPVVAMLLDVGVDPNATDADGWTPLHWAAACGYAGNT